MMDIKLKPCPFCGSEAEIEEYNQGFRVICTNIYNCAIKQNQYTSKDKAIESWNKRIEDVRENITANWIHVYYYRPSTNSYDIEMGKCSNCNHEYSYDTETGISFEDYKFCPECGADMRGGKDNND